jgi:hypothetical protein
MCMVPGMNCRDNLRCIFAVCLWQTAGGQCPGGVAFAPGRPDAPPGHRHPCRPREALQQSLSGAQPCCDPPKCEGPPAPVPHSSPPGGGKLHQRNRMRMYPSKGRSDSDVHQLLAERTQARHPRTSVTEEPPPSRRRPSSAPCRSPCRPSPAGEP